MNRILPLLSLALVPLVAQAQSVGASGRLRGEASGPSLPPLPAPQVLAAPLRGGQISVPGATDQFVETDALLAALGGRPLSGALARYAWPAPGRAGDGVLRIFVQGLNTPRADDPQGDIGADARLSQYIQQEYIPAPVISIHNWSHLESPTPVAGPLGWWDGALRRALPYRKRDSYRSAAMRFTGVGANRAWTSGEVARLSRLLEANLTRPDPEPRHLIGYSDGALLVEHALKLAVARAQAARGREHVQRALRDGVFIECWGAATQPIVEGPRRLLVHAADDLVVARRILGRRMGVLTADDLPARFRDRTVIVRFESPHSGWNGHNALTTIGPALKAIQTLELGPIELPNPALEGVGLSVTPALELYERLAARGQRDRCYRLDELDVDFDRFREFLWVSGDAAQERPAQD